MFLESPIPGESGSAHPSLTKPETRAVRKVRRGRSQSAYSARRRRKRHVVTGRRRRLKRGTVSRLSKRRRRNPVVGERRKGPVSWLTKEDEEKGGRGRREPSQSTTKEEQGKQCWANLSLKSFQLLLTTANPTLEHSFI